MALNPSQVTRARLEAREFLEYSIYLLATLLDVDLENITSSMVIPVSEDHHEFVYYESLKKQITILETLDI